MIVKDIVAVDMDDVCLDLTGGIRRVIKTEYGIDLPPFDRWEIDGVLKPILGMPWMKWMRKRANLWSTFPAVEGAIGSLDLLRADGYYLELVTSKPDWAEASVFQWLGKWRPAFQRVTIVGPQDRKVDFTDAGLLIDDKPQNCIEFVEAGRKAMLFACSHNLKTPDDPRIQRVANWKEVREALL